MNPKSGELILPNGHDKLVRQLTDFRSENLQALEVARKKEAAKREQERKESAAQALRENKEEVERKFAIDLARLAVEHCQINESQLSRLSKADIYRLAELLASNHKVKFWALAQRSIWGCVSLTLGAVFANFLIWCWSTPTGAAFFADLSIRSLFTLVVGIIGFGVTRLVGEGAFGEGFNLSSRYRYKFSRFKKDPQNFPYGKILNIQNTIKTQFALECERTRTDN